MCVYVQPYVHSCIMHSLFLILFCASGDKKKAKGISFSFSLSMCIIEINKWVTLYMCIHIHIYIGEHTRIYHFWIMNEPSVSFSNVESNVLVILSSQADATVGVGIHLSYLYLYMYIYIDEKKSTI
jgi:hypothetical protein